MSRSKNTISFSDVSTSPVKLKYSASYADSDFSNVGISIVRGINIPVTSSAKVPQFKINYNLMEQLFYRGYISGSLLKTGSAYDPSYQSTAASGSLDEDVRFFPTGSGAQVVYMYIPRNVFGEQIARKSFLLSTPRYYIYDDGNGNLLDDYIADTKVGNIIYSQAFAIITNPDYVCYFVDTEFDFSLEENKTDIVIPSLTPSVSVTPSITPSVTTTPSVTPSVTKTPSVSVTPGVSLSNTPSISVTPSVSVTPSISVSKTPSVSVTPSVTPSISITPSITPPETVQIAFYARHKPFSLDPPAMKILYSTDSGATWNSVGSFSDTNCTYIGATSVIKNSSLQVKIVTDDAFETNWKSTRTLSLTPGGSCPDFNSGDGACQWSITTNSDRYLYFTVWNEDTGTC